MAHMGNKIMIYPSMCGQNLKSTSSAVVWNMGFCEYVVKIVIMNTWVLNISNLYKKLSSPASRQCRLHVSTAAFFSARFLIESIEHEFYNPCIRYDWHTPSALSHSQLRFTYVVVPRQRAKKRIFSVRNADHQWDLKQQRPELWSFYNTQVNKGESVRVFPL